MNLPNRLTLLRALLVPVFILALAYWTSERDFCRFLALAVFLAACITDALDGWIARRRNQKTRLGSLIDPAADKILLLSTFLALAWLPDIPPDRRLPAWFTIIVVSRDLLLLAGAAIMFVMQNRFEARTHFLGKITTAAQMLLVIACLADAPRGALHVFLIPVALATVVSGLIYLRAGAIRLASVAEHA